MVKVIAGVKGTGKTKTLIELVNASASASMGSVICIEQGDKLNFDISHKARLIDTQSFFVEDANALYGFIAGIAASNHDITEIFVDSALKICNNNLDAFEKFVTEINGLSEKCSFNCIMTASVAPESCSELLRKFF
jgi:hypothetical protein